MRLRRRSPWPVAIIILVFTTLSVALGLVTASNKTVAAINKAPEVTRSLSSDTAGIVNYLLVGSDSRAGFAAGDDPYAIGSENDQLGQRSDTLIVMRYDSKTKSVALLSIPRDLYVGIPGKNGKAKINAAYGRGADVLVATVTSALGIPIHHYIEVDFHGFQDVVDSIGGVTICIPHRARDQHIGLVIARKGCHRLNGSKSLAYARSRYYEEWINGDWVQDGTSDIGRAARQRAFITAMLKDAARYVASNPFQTDEILNGLAKALKVDPGLDVVRFARRMRNVSSNTVDSFALSVKNAKADGQSVLLLLEDSSAPVLQFFAGKGPKPVVDQPDAS